MKKNLILIILAAGFYTTAQVKVGDNPTTINASAMLEFESLTKGVLPPRMTNLQAYTIATPAIGLMVFNTTLNCLSYYDGTTWNCSYVAPQPAPAIAPIGSTYTNHKNGMSGTLYLGNILTVFHPLGATFNNLVGCQNKMISAGKTSCQPSVTGESGTVYPLELINGQCWFKRNLNEIPSNFALNTPTSWLDTQPFDLGYFGYLNLNDTSGASGWGLIETSDFGLLYQWSAAMNNSRAERARGSCPIGFHVPSDCEWSYLEHGLGMSIPDNELSGNAIERGGGPNNVGFKLKASGPYGNDVSKFTGKFSNRRDADGQFLQPNIGYYFSSTLIGTSDPYIPNAYNRAITRDNIGVWRQVANAATGQSVRCLQD